MDISETLKMHSNGWFNFLCPIAATIALLSEGDKHQCLWKLQFIIDADNMVGQARVNFGKRLAALFPH